MRARSVSWVPASTRVPACISANHCTREDRRKCPGAFLPARRADPALPVEPLVPQERQIVPTKLDLWFVYFLGPGNPRPNLTRGLEHHFYQTRKGWE
jgi:hypothetical protein